MKYKQETFDELIKKLTDDDVNARITTITVLGNMKDPRAVEPLINLLIESWGLNIRDAVEIALTNMGNLAIPELIKVLHESTSTIKRKPDPHVTIVRILGEIDYGGVEIPIKTQAVMALIELLTNERVSICETAVVALGKIGAKDPKLVEKAIEPLIELLLTVDKEVGVRVVAVEALRDIKDPRAVEPLIKLLEDGDVDVRVAAANALINMKDPRAIKPLVTLFLLKENYDLDIIDTVKHTLRYRMGNLAIPELIELLHESTSTLTS